MTGYNNIMLIINTSHSLCQNCHYMYMYHDQSSAKRKGGGREAIMSYNIAANLICHTVTRGICDQIAGVIEKVWCHSTGVCP